MFRAWISKSWCWIALVDEPAETPLAPARCWTEMLNCSEYWRRPETFFETWSSAFSKIKYVCPVFHQTFHSGQGQVKACITTEILCHQNNLASVGLWERFQCNIFFYMKLNKINLYIRWVIHCHSTSHWRPINIIVHQITGNSFIKIVIRLPIKKTQKLQWVGFCFDQRY